MRSIFFISSIALLVATACACDQQAQADTSSSAPVAAASSDEAAADPVAHGKQLFAAKTCSACHQMDAKVVGPPLRGVVKRRGAEWVAKMIQNPDQMVKTDPVAQQLFEEYNKTPMPNVNLTDAEAAAIVAYLESES